MSRGRSGADPHKGRYAKPYVKLAPLKNVGKVHPPTEHNALMARFVVKVVAIMTDEAVFKAHVLRRPAEAHLAETPEALVAREIHLKQWKAHIKDLFDAHVIGELRAGCVVFFTNYFAVLKDIDSARAIFDAWEFNAACNDSPALPLKSQVDILRLITEMPNQHLIRFVSADFLNWFYQIILPGFMRKYFGLQCEERVYAANVLPMGWTWAPYIAQAYSWAILLKHDDANALGIPDDVLSLETPPSYIRTTKGSLVFLIYDTVLVVAVDEQDARLWHAHITARATACNAALKYITDVSPTVSFDGMEFRVTPNGFQWRLDSDTLDHWIVEAGAELTCTAEILWSFLGYIRFAHSILRIPHRIIGRVAKEQSRIAKAAGSERLDYRCLRPEIAGTLKEAQRFVLALLPHQKSWTHQRSHLAILYQTADVLNPTKRPRLETTPLMIAWLAGDARPTRWAIMQYDSVGQIVESETLARVINPPVNADVAECIATRMAATCPAATKAPLVFIAGDSRTAAFAFVRGYAKESPEMDAEVELAHGIMGSRCYVHVDVSTDVNVSDIPTRDDKVYSEEDRVFRTSQTWKCLQDAYESWKKWPVEFVTRPANCQVSVGAEAT